jgi:PPOX class probable F420-dependent enzyme
MRYILGLRTVTVKGYSTEGAGVVSAVTDRPSLKASNVKQQRPTEFSGEASQMDKAIEGKIQTLLDQHRTMTLATLRPDGWPQATTVGYANDGLTLYFLCGPESQKAANLARDSRVSLTIDDDTPQVMEITALSMAARAERVVDTAEAEKALRLLMQRYPEQKSLPAQMPKPSDVAVFRVRPKVISVLDYTQGFGHTDLVAIFA